MTTPTNELLIDKDFKDVIEKISYAPDELKILWTEIYKQASSDRRSAQALLDDLFTKTVGQSDSTKHITNSKALSLYLEKCNKATDQLQKLSDSIEKAMEEDEMIDGEQLYNSSEFNDN